MKNWTLVKGSLDGICELDHLCPGCSFISAPDNEGNWMCLECGEYAPEEICFVAELARCRGIPQKNMEEAKKRFGK